MSVFAFELPASLFLPQVSPLQNASSPDPNLPFPTVEFFISYISYDSPFPDSVQIMTFTIVNEDGSLPTIVDKITPMEAAADVDFEFALLGDPAQNSISGFSTSGQALPASYESISQIARVQLQQTGELDEMPNPCLGDIT